MKSAQLLLAVKGVPDLSKKQLLELVEKQAQEITLLRQKIDLLVRKVFGVSSEKIDPSQLDLFLLQPENAPGKPCASSAPEEAEAQPRRRERSPEAVGIARRSAGGGAGDRSAGGEASS